MKKISLSDLQNNNDWEEAVIVFTAGSSEKSLSEIERSYKISRDNKFFYRPPSGSTSLYGECLDGTEKFLELTQYIYGGIVKVDYCYIIK